MKTSWDSSPEALSVEPAVRAILASVVSSITAESVLHLAMKRSRTSLSSPTLHPALLDEIQRGLRVFVPSADALREIERSLTALSERGRSSSNQAIAIMIRDEAGVIDARTRARTMARDQGFDRTDQAKIATGVSELARNIHQYARQGEVRLTPLTVPRIGLRVEAVDQGPGIRNLQEVLSGNYRSSTGMGLGLCGCRKIMDEFEIDTKPGIGTRVTMHKYR